ncbi:MAG: hypothetical protein GX366_01710 [Epulopiscium sp.]|nr:hypothetical protein [Candidatus Epulonipiscium sp.]
MERKLIPDDIEVPSGYNVEVFASGLTTPINMVITDKGDMLIGDAGVSDGDGKVLILKENGPELIASGFNPPLTGVNFYNDNIYVSHRGFITIIKPDGTMEDIVSGLPSWGDHHNNKVIFGPDGKMYFGQGTATNSGVVGEDNEGWINDYPFFHDYPGEDILLRDNNFQTPNLFNPNDSKPVYTGAYSPFGMEVGPASKIRGTSRANGSIMRANPDGSDLELLAWGLRNPFRINFDGHGRLFCANHGTDVRGSRPIDKCPDEFQLIMPGIWYGWPDFSAGLPVTLPFFKPEGMPAPSFLLKDHPMIPPKPFASFPNHSATMGFDFYNNSAYVSEFGSLAPTTTGGKPDPRVGHRVSRLDMSTGKISDFAINKTGLPATATGGGGLERPIDVIFDKKGTMYVVDFGIAPKDNPSAFEPATGVIWKISRS